MREEAKNTYQAKLNDAEKLIDQLKEEAKTSANEWRAEREQFQERIAMLERTPDTAAAVRTEKADDYKEMERKLEEAMQSKEQLQLDLQRTVSELNSRMQPAGKEEPVHAVNEAVTAMVEAEMVRVRLHLDEIEKMLADPDTDLGPEIRLNRERGEIQAYLKGLRYSLGEVTLQSPAVEDPCHV
jgi:chromosome segregation ATPase